MQSFQPHELNVIFPPNPDWAIGSGANDTTQPTEKTTVDPYEDGRESLKNYRLLVSAITPRPIALISSVSATGSKNLAPFSYFNVMNSDPPIFTVGMSTSHLGVMKDSAKNILETGECTINLIGEWFVEAANESCINAPSDVEEWGLTGLTQEPATINKSPLVKESAFSIECKLVAHHDWYSKTDSTKHTGTLLILEGIMFHARSDLLNEEKNGLDLAKLKPVSRLGGITYGRTTEVYDLARPMWTEDKK